jgi:hypothetical protein
MKAEGGAQSEDHGDNVEADPTCSSESRDSVDSDYLDTRNSSSLLLGDRNLAAADADTQDSGRKVDYGDLERGTREFVSNNTGFFFVMASQVHGGAPGRSPQQCMKLTSCSRSFSVL